MRLGAVPVGVGDPNGLRRRPRRALAVVDEVDRAWAGAGGRWSAARAAGGGDGRVLPLARGGEKFENDWAGRCAGLCARRGGEGREGEEDEEGSGEGGGEGSEKVTVDSLVAVVVECGRGASGGRVGGRRNAVGAAGDGNGGGGEKKRARFSWQDDVMGEGGLMGRERHARAGPQSLKSTSSSPSPPAGGVDQLAPARKPRATSSMGGPSLALLPTCEPGRAVAAGRPNAESRGVRGA